MIIPPRPNDQTIFGTQSDDVIAGFRGNDTLLGRAGNDIFIEGFATWLGPDQYYQGSLYLENRERYRFGQGDDVIDGGEGNDFLAYTEIQSDISVNLKNGLITTTFGLDTIISIEGILTGAGDDRVRGLNAQTQVFLGEGDDTVQKFSDGSFADGGDGVDTLDLRRVDGAVVADLSQDYVAVGRHVTGTFPSFEEILGNLTKRNELTGSAANEILVGGDRSDTLLGAKGDDTLHGGGAVDSLFGGEGRDQLFGEDGDDLLVGGSEKDRLFGGRGSDLLEGGDDNDWLFGDSGKDELLGGIGDDRLFGGAGADYLDGGEGYNELHGGSGNDRLISSIGIIYGDDGDDIILPTLANLVDGGAGADQIEVSGLLTNGERRGPFWISGGTGDDTIDVNIISSGSRSIDLSIEAGEGDDVINVNDDGFEFGYHQRNKIDGGEGIDVLTLSGAAKVLIGVEQSPAKYVSTSSGVRVFGIEELNLLSDRLDLVLLRDLPSWDYTHETGRIELETHNDGNTLVSRGGKDTFSLHSNQNSVSSGSGDDIIGIESGARRNIVESAAGDDSVFDGGVRNQIDTGFGDDSVRISGFGGEVDTGGGDDVITVSYRKPNQLNYGENSSIKVKAGNGNDTLWVEHSRFVDAEMGDGNDRAVFDDIGVDDAVFDVDFGSGSDELEIRVMYGSTIRVSLGSESDAIAFFFRGSSLFGELIVSDFNPDEDYFKFRELITSIDDFESATDTEQGLVLHLSRYGSTSGAEDFTIILEGVTAAMMSEDNFVFY